MFQKEIVNERLVSGFDLLICKRDNPHFPTVRGVLLLCRGMTDSRGSEIIHSSSGVNHML